jgi:hypothetical protein
MSAQLIHPIFFRPWRDASTMWFQISAVWALAFAANIALLFI